MFKPVYHFKCWLPEYESTEHGQPVFYTRQKASQARYAFHLTLVDYGYQSDFSDISKIKVAKVDRLSDFKLEYFRSNCRQYGMEDFLHIGMPVKVRSRNKDGRRCIVTGRIVDWHSNLMIQTDDNQYLHVHPKESCIVYCDENGRQCVPGKLC